MPPRLLSNYDLAAASPSPGHRASIAPREAAFELPPSGWRHAPPLRDLMCTSAAHHLSRSMPMLSAPAALSEACRAIGLAEDPYRQTRPTDGMSRRLRRWAAAAKRDPDISVRADSVQSDSPTASHIGSGANSSARLQSSFRACRGMAACH